MICRRSPWDCPSDGIPMLCSMAFLPLQTFQIIRVFAFLEVGDWAAPSLLVGTTHTQLPEAVESHSTDETGLLHNPEEGTTPMQPIRELRADFFPLLTQNGPSISQVARAESRTWVLQYIPHRDPWLLLKMMTMTMGGCMSNRNDVNDFPKS